MKKEFPLILLISCMFITLYCNCFSILHRTKLFGKENPCLLAPVEGRCREVFQKYFYNSSTKRCETFIYGGCGGNKNNFWTEEECREACQDGEPQKRPKLINIELMNPFARNTCSYPRNPGRCYGSHKRFYFNGETCVQFTYRGCLGNPNNFRTKKQCMETCGLEYDNGSGEEIEDGLFSFSML